jgi:cation diffusion facilitator CzcD-associated flavoprotein CzcO
MATEQPYDVLILGAGLSGIYSLIYLRKKLPNLRIGVLEAADDLGGTWYWNCYPGCRFDSESVSYGFSFDKELLQEWHWKEAFSPQPETLKYIRRVADRHDVRKDVQFNTRIQSARWNEDSRMWVFIDHRGLQYYTRFFISCLGFLSSPTLPNITGIEDFEGQSFHTSRWPRDLDVARSFNGKRIGVIGTGATGIQLITALSKQATIASLAVFQRTANWSAPLRNHGITHDEMSKYRTEYDSIFQRCAETPTCFIHQADPRKSLDVTEKERLDLWENVYAQPGFAKWLGVFSDTYTDQYANEMYSKFMADKIRQRVRSSTVAESLIPTNHGFGTRRVPLESGYFEAFNKSNVHLVDLKETPMSRVTSTGIKTSDGRTHDLDVLIFATGFDAITGAFSAIEWNAKDGRPLIASSNAQDVEKPPIWPDHVPKTFLGLTAPAMPNMFMVLGPHQPFGNATRSIEHAVEVIGDMLQHCNDHSYTYIEPTMKAAEEWTEHVVECSKGGLINNVDSWMTGVNTNVKGKQVRTVARYTGSAIEYRRKCRECKVSGYQEFVFD